VSDSTWPWRSRWISAEGPGVVPTLAAALKPSQIPEQAVFLLGQGAHQLVGLADPHGAWLQWLDQHLPTSSDQPL
jgi:hypothetical protein